MVNVSKKIELVANVAIIIVACLLAVVLIKNLTKRQPESAPSLGQSQPYDSQKLSVLNIDWRQSKQTLLLAVSSNCHFCTESAPFYKQLANARGQTRLIAVLPQPVNEGKRYLDGLGVAVDEVKQTPLGSIDVSGTPTILLINQDGAVIKTWIGKLPQDQQEEVLKLL
jgi:hypothetical protein